MQVIAVSNQKGGVAKTTTAAAIAQGIARDGARVLAVDLDPQCSLSFAYGIEPGGGGAMTLQDVLDGKPIVGAIRETPVGDVVPCTLRLAAADMSYTRIGREQLLSDALRQVRDKYDYVVLDTPPSLGILTNNALVAAQGIVIPVTCDAYCLQAVSQLYETVQEVRRYANRDLRLLGLAVTRYDGRSNLAKDYLGRIHELAGKLGTRVFETLVREGVAVRRSQDAQTSIYDNPTSKQAQDYAALVEEVLAALNG